MNKVSEGDQVRVNNQNGVVTGTQVVGTGAETVKVVTVQTETGKTVVTAASRVTVTRKADCN